MIRFSKRVFNGLLPNDEFQAHKRPVLDGPDEASNMPSGVVVVYPWRDCVNEVDDQGNESSCVAASFLGILEVLLRFWIDRDLFAGGLQLARRRLHALAQTIRYPDSPEYDPRRGLLLGDAFLAAKQAKLIPEDAEEILLSFNVAEWAEALKVSPIHHGIGVYAGLGSPNPETGEVPDKSPFEDYFGGHAIHEVRIFRGRAGMPMHAIPQTWGVRYAWHGVCSFSHTNMRRISWDAPRVYKMDRQWFVKNREFEDWIEVGS